MAAGALTAPFGWQAINAGAAAWFVAAGLFGAAGHFLMIEAFRLAEAAVVSPVRYTALIWGAVMGYAVWGEVPDAWVLTGSAVIIASGMAMIRAGSRR
jgi:drug/metabolite transporter (DMT)-like permease